MSSTHRHITHANYRPIGGPGLPEATTPASSSSSSSNPLDAISGAWAGFLSSGLNSAQVALGALLIAAATLILVSQTSAGASAGGLAKGGIRRGLRAIPGVGVLA